MATDFNNAQFRTGNILENLQIKSNQIDQISKGATKYLKSLNTFREDSKLISDTFSHTLKKIQSVEPTSSLCQSLESISKFQNEMCNFLFEFYSQMDNHINHLKNYSRNEILLPLKEHKKNFEKTNSKYQSEISKAKRSHGTFSEKSKTNYSLQFNDIFQNVKNLDQKLTFQWVDNIVNYFDSYQKFLSHGTESIKKLEPQVETMKNNLKRQEKDLIPRPAFGSIGIGVVFGISLKNILLQDQKKVPNIIEQSYQFLLEEKGFLIEGIFRIGGSKKRVDQCKLRIDQGDDVERVFQEEDGVDVHVVSSLLRLYLRELPEPPFTFKAYPELMKISLDNPKDELITSIQKLLSSLPTENYDLLLFLFRMCCKVVEHEEENKMNSKNLSVVFSNNLLSTEFPNVETMVEDMNKGNALVEFIISNAKEIFPDIQKLDEIQERPKVDTSLKSSWAGANIGLSKQSSSNKLANSLNYLKVGAVREENLPIVTKKEDMFDNNSNNNNLPSLKSSSGSVLETVTPNTKLSFPPPPTNSPAPESKTYLKLTMINDYPNRSFIDEKEKESLSDQVLQKESLSDQALQKESLSFGDQTLQKESLSFSDQALPRPYLLFNLSKNVENFVYLFESGAGYETLTTQLKLILKTLKEFNEFCRSSDFIFTRQLIIDDYQSGMKKVIEATRNLQNSSNQKNQDLKNSTNNFISLTEKLLISYLSEFGDFGKRLLTESIQNFAGVLTRALKYLLGSSQDEIPESQVLQHINSLRSLSISFGWCFREYKELKAGIQEIEFCVNGLFEKSKNETEEKEQTKKKGLDTINSMKHLSNLIHTATIIREENQQINTETSFEQASTLIQPLTTFYKEHQSDPQNGEIYSKLEQLLKEFQKIQSDQDHLSSQQTIEIHRSIVSNFIQLDEITFESGVNPRLQMALCQYLLYTSYEIIGLTPATFSLVSIITTASKCLSKILMKHQGG